MNRVMANSMMQRGFLVLQIIASVAAIFGGTSELINPANIVLSAGGDEDANTILRNNPYLPTDCGKDLLTRDPSRTETVLTEFPWMVLLKYDTLSGSRLACAGALISSRYVLTAAHCISGQTLPKTYSARAVILGEYNIRTDPDCVSNRTTICSDPPVTISIEEIVIHESYMPPNNGERTQHDVALIRLSREVQFTDYIQPICLPTTSNLAPNLWLAGWGKTLSDHQSDVKLKIQVPPVDLPTCTLKYAKAGITLTNLHICVGGQSKDTCEGDGGGPLMSPERAPDGSRKWTVAGIVSFGPKPCAMPTWPSVNTKVVAHVPWILSKIRA